MTDDGIDEVGRATLAREKAFAEKAAAEEQRLHGDESHIPMDQLDNYRKERIALRPPPQSIVPSPDEQVAEATGQTEPVADTLHATAARRQPSERHTTSLGDVK